MNLGRSRSVLVVEDDRDVSEAIAGVLEDEGYRVTTADNGREALVMLLGDHFRPSLILLDLMMPVMDGREFMTELKRLPQLADLPVVLLSAGARVQEEAAELATYGCLRKPVELDRLLEVVARLIDGA